MDGHTHGCTECKEKFICACPFPLSNSVCNRCVRKSIGENPDDTKSSWEEDGLTFAEYVEREFKSVKEEILELDEKFNEAMARIDELEEELEDD